MKRSLRLRTGTALVGWGLCGLTVALVGARVALAIADPSSASPITNDEVPAGGVPVALLEFLVCAALGAVGALVASRRPRNPVGWLVCVAASFFALGLLAERTYWHEAIGDPENTTLLELAAWVANWFWVPAVLPLLMFVPLLFPSGRPPTPRWRWVGWCAGAAGVLVLVAYAFGPGPLSEHSGVDNPLGVSAVPDEALNAAATPLLLIGLLGSVASVVVRFRRSRGVERQQLKWFTAAASLMVVMWPLGALLGEDTWWVFFMGGFLFVAGAVAVAILRYRLYDIDLVINRALVYGALTATLAAAYLATVLLLQLALRPLTSESGLAVAGSTLAVAALFRPARRRIQAAVDQRFFRRRYDAGRTLEGFSTRLRQQVDLDSLAAELDSVVRDTVQPAHVSLWMREARR